MLGCVVVGGGPSATKFYPAICEANCRKVPVVAASTMLLPLQRAGIRVDVTCVIDPGSIMVLHFKGARTGGHLVYFRDVVPTIPRDWEGQKTVVDDLPGPSVINLCVDWTIKSGHKSIHLFGADFCYSDGKSHADGVVTAFKPAGIEVEGYLTSWDLVDFRNSLRAQMRTNPNIRFYRHGEGLPL